MFVVWEAARVIPPAVVPATMTGLPGRGAPTVRQLATPRLCTHPKALAAITTRGTPTTILVGVVVGVMMISRHGLRLAVRTLPATTATATFTVTPSSSWQTVSLAAVATLDFTR